MTTKLTADTVKYLVVHSAATQASTDIGVPEITRWHRARGFLEIGYHFVIRRDGTVEPGRAITKPGAHVADHNSHSIGICMVGGLDPNGKAEDNYTLDQKAALAALLLGLLPQYPKAEVLGHRDLSPDRNGDGKVSPNEWLKDCPCFDVREWFSATVHPDVGHG
jgi:N-acetylmuramoyl-L-alanine amidase